jgi:SAM-dependent methyltransferase
MQLATGYWASAALLAANRVGVFGALADGAKSLSEIVAATGTTERGLRPLLESVIGLGFVTFEGGAYSIAPAAAAFLVPGRPGSLASGLEWSFQQMPAWANLAEAVKSGSPAVPPKDMLGGDPEQTRTFVSAMRERAMGPAHGVAGFLPMEGVQSLLDVGGGPGAYAAVLARRNPTLQVTILDLPDIVEAAKPWVAEQGLAERVQFIPGDATGGEYGEGQYDAALLSGVLHRMSPETCQRMIAGAAKALRPGGRVMVVDMMLSDDRSGPLFSALFSLQMLLTTEEGAVFAKGECADWMRSAGLTEVESKDLPQPLPYSLVTGVQLGS